MRSEHILGVHQCHHWMTVVYFIVVLLMILARLSQARFLLSRQNTTHTNLIVVCP